ncbi:class I SAM-dependent methyltransferase, partial [Frankia sp. Cr1]|uniref:class I SAM-dependent methyltransferase n=1 Tax=Frankia sp. Cr1 TaxID=3073931 RepID=UPI002AD2F860
MSEHLDPVAVNTAVWEQHARARIVAGDLDRRPAVHQFRWTRTSIDDPGPELLGDVRGKHVVELGCGTGDNLAYLVDHRGALGVGIDPAPSQLRRARARWPSPVFHCTDAAPYLATCEPIDVCYSVFGAIGFCPPAPLLKLIYNRLVPGGLLAFSIRSGGLAKTRKPTCRLDFLEGMQGPVVRYDCGSDEWTDIFDRMGFCVAVAIVADEASGPTTLILAAHLGASTET